MLPHADRICEFGTMGRTGWLVVTTISLAALFSAAAVESAERPSDRWLYLQLNLQVPENVDIAAGLFRRAAAADYNAVVLADYKLNILDRVPEHYFRHADRIKELCRELKLELIPAVAPIGYSDGLLAHDPNLAEGLPVRQAEFQVQPNGDVTLAHDESLVPGGDFETSRGHLATGFGFQDGAGEFSWIDTTEKHAGRSSLRWERSSGSDYLNARVSQRISVKPGQQLHASVWIKTRQYSAAGSVKMFAIGADGRILSHSNLAVKPDQDWTQHHVVLNTLENTEIQFYCGTWGLARGQLWMDDLRLQETAFVNLIRRDSCPLVVEDAETGSKYVEGRDFAQLVDPKLGVVPWAGNFDVYHEPPRMTLKPGSRIQPGARLHVSYYHTVTIYDGQVCCCLAEPAVMELVRDQVQRVEKLFSPRTYFLSHDEIRVANWCPACRRDGRTAGQLLAENVSACAKTVRSINPQARLCVWSDMFDPHHNAVAGPFYLVNGPLAESWTGLPQDLIIVNWNSDKPADSLPFFTGRGHQQVLAGFYDADPAAIRNWQRVGRETKSKVSGAMYTTWQNDFSKLEDFARHAWGR